MAEFADYDSFSGASDYQAGDTGRSFTSDIGLPSSAFGGGSSGYGSTSSGQSQSTSQPTSVETRQTDWGLLQSQLLSALGDQQYQWAMNQYAKGEGVTDQTIANFLELSGRGKGLADTLLTQYKDQIAPLISKYIADAGSYASEERQRFKAGEAMSSVAQADQAAISEMERKLGGFGVNVNSGRYQDMMLSSRVQDAAARAGAGTKAAMDVEDRGRAMEEKAIAMGQQMPGQAMNAVNTAYAGLNGAENAILGLMNTGAKLAESAAPFFQAAVGANKIPPVGQVSQQTSQQQSESRTPGPQASGGGGGGSKGGGQPKGGQQQPRQQQPQQPKGGGKPEGGDKEGGGRGPGGAGSADAKAAAGGGPSTYGATYKIPGGGGKKEEEPGGGTGAPEEPGYQGPIGYVGDDGTIYPEFSPGLGRDASGDFLTPETTDWGGAEQTSNWSLPEVGERGYNVDPSITPDSYQQGSFLPGGWGDQFNTPSTTWEDIDQQGDVQIPANAQPTSGEGYDPWGGQAFDQFGQTGYTGFGDQSGGGGDQTGGWGDDTGADWTNTDPWAGQDFNQWGDDTGTDWNNPSEGQDFTGWGDQESYQGVDESGYNWDTGEWTDSYQGVDESGWGNTDWGNQDSYQGVDESGYNWDTGEWTQDNSSYQGVDESGFNDMSGYDNYDYGAQYDVGGGGESYQGYDESGFSGDYESYDYARGGRVRRPPRRPMPGRPMRGRGVMPTTGGAVPRSASPSRGQQTDDISARLNAGEYVIPKDVVSHKGTEFFTKMIQNSRKLRTGMAGAKPKPTMKSALPPGRPTFRSRPLPPR